MRIVCTLCTPQPVLRALSHPVRRHVVSFTVRAFWDSARAFGSESSGGTFLSTQSVDSRLSLRGAYPAARPVARAGQTFPLKLITLSLQHTVSAP